MEYLILIVALVWNINDILKYMFGVITLDVSFRLNPVPITSHFGIDSRLVFFSTVHSPAYYSDKIPDISITWYNQRSPRITLASGKKKKDQCDKERGVRNTS